MFAFEKQYVQFIAENGVGKNDKKSDSRKSYVSYINSVQKYLGIVIDEGNLSSEEDVQNLMKKLKESKLVSNKTTTNYGSAMRQYVAMIKFIMK
ncbi:hypothetical protein C4D02_RS21645 [Vibrio parahaemolyticus]|uniref:hypothetical protein n=1 Tax=Vibrio harveyi group TaxID=717610 RepID=UPI001D6DB990|nr:hypothetical protein [Vibrio parahaemolyticus]ELC9718770.1 hypothetical protein [Vibrio vulnificus]EGR3150081.1 hypothetical protein [Vibrio parahaemolyticus]EGR3164319.1 hypothetical protein [Vibrio parahaemolyticus]EJG0431706.1 hypothetical protein [Vibrio parahaemolyticus]ELS0763528.1 hypothetical protein [Vibrio vulnificus]